MADLPSSLWFPHAEFGELFDQHHAEGVFRAKTSRIAFVGLARNCANALRKNLGLCARVGSEFAGWRLHVESNDCLDNTPEVLTQFCDAHPVATFAYSDLGREHLPTEFAGPRTIALAEYRDACQQWVRSFANDCNYVAVVDFDIWGGFSSHGLFNALGWLVEMQGAYGMASVSLFEHDFGSGPQWLHYDLWALRGVGQRDCYWDTYRGGHGVFGYSWHPPIGSPPVLVASAFGGLALYRTGAYLAGRYDGTSDCEHVTFHQSVANATGQALYVCPAMRTIVRWMEPADGNGIDGV